MMMEEDVEALRAENAAVRAENATLRAQLGGLSERLGVLEKKKTSVPAFVCPHKGGPAKKARMTRAAEHDAGRRRQDPTRIVAHAVDACPDCGYTLRGESVRRTRQVIDLPEPVPVEVIGMRQDSESRVTGTQRVGYPTPFIEVR